MKTLLPLLAMLLAPALAGAIPVPIPRPGDTVFVNDPNGMGVGTGTKLEDGSVMGPLCPPSICPTNETETAAAAFNAASQIPPAGREWASPDCTHIPCRLKDEDDAADDAGETTVSEIVVTAPRKSKGNPEKSNAGATFAATPEGESGTLPGGQRMTPEQLAQLRAEQAARDKGFNPGMFAGGADMFRGDGSTRGGSAVVAPDRVASIVGDLLGGLIGDDLGGSDGTGTGPSSQTRPKVVQGALGDVVQVDTNWETVQKSRGGLVSLDVNAGEQIDLLKKVAGAGPNGVSAGNTTADDGTSGCQQGPGDFACLGAQRQAAP